MHTLSFSCHIDSAVLLCFSLLQLKVLDGEKEQKGREVAELQARLSLEEQREEERGKEVFTLKQRLTQVEMTRDAVKKEVRKVAVKRGLKAHVVFPLL